MGPIAACVAAAGAGFPPGASGLEQEFAGCLVPLESEAGGDPEAAPESHPHPGGGSSLRGDVLHAARVALPPRDAEGGPHRSNAKKAAEGPGGSSSDEVAAAQPTEGPAYFSNFRELFISGPESEERFHRISEEIGRFDERRFGTLFSFCFSTKEGEKQPRAGSDNLDAGQRKYFENVYRQVRDLAAFDIDGIRRGRLTPEAAETVSRWICIHEILQEVAPELFPDEPPHGLGDETTKHQDEPRGGRSRRQQDATSLPQDASQNQESSLTFLTEGGISENADQSDPTEESQGRRTGRRTRGTAVGAGQGSAVGKRGPSKQPNAALDDLQSKETLSPEALVKSRVSNARQRRGSAPSSFAQVNPSGSGVVAEGGGPTPAQGGAIT